MSSSSVKRRKQLLKKKSVTNNCQNPEEVASKSVRITNQMKLDIIQMHLNEGLSLTEVSKRLGISIQKAHYYVRNKDVIMEKFGNKDEDLEEIEEEQAAEVKERVQQPAANAKLEAIRLYHQLRMSIVDVAQRLSISEPLVRYYVGETDEPPKDDHLRNLRNGLDDSVNSAWKAFCAEENDRRMEEEKKDDDDVEQALRRCKAIKQQLTTFVAQTRQILSQFGSTLNELETGLSQFVYRRKVPVVKAGICDDI